MAAEEKLEPCTVLATFLCPGCKEEVTIGEFAEGPGILHPMPMCETYEKLPPEEFWDRIKKDVS